MSEPLPLEGDVDEDSDDDDEDEDYVPPHGEDSDEEVPEREWYYGRQAKTNGIARRLSSGIAADELDDMLSESSDDDDSDEYEEECIGRGSRGLDDSDSEDSSDDEE